MFGVSFQMTLVNLSNYNIVDVLMTHMPPFNVLDLAWDRSQKSKDNCEYCSQSHLNYRHWGCYDLFCRVMEVKPKLHLFGHVHDEVGFKQINDIVFCNSAMDLAKKAHVLSLYE
jgi:Icc-related predicted phosphoesterase